jgi:hypothetical protein
MFNAFVKLKAPTVLVPCVRLRRVRPQGPDLSNPVIRLPGSTG